LRDSFNVARAALRLNQRISTSSTTMALLSLVISLLCIAGVGAAVPLAKKDGQLEPSFALRGASVKKGGPSCSCEAISQTWKPCVRTVPRCVFIDLGAADGNSFNVFISNGYGNVSYCPSQQWKAILVEANPLFDKPLNAEAAKYPDHVTSMGSTAAYMCEAQTSFYIDTVNDKNNFWGSSLSKNHQDIQHSNGKKVTVPTMNLNKILFEQTIPSDWVMVKMDIEGAEYDVLPCLAKSISASLIDRLYMEQHNQTWSNTGTTLAEMETAKATLKARGVDIPDYHSFTFIQNRTA